MRVFFTLVGVTIGACASISCARPQPATTEGMAKPPPPPLSVTLSLSADQIDSRGSELRTAIEREFISLRLTHIPVQGEFRVTPLGLGSDASGLILRYVPLGLPIEQAEEILERAGLTITAKRRPELAYRTEAVMNDTVNGTPRHLIVQLAPQRPSDGAAVVALQAYMRKDDSPPR